MTNFAHKNDEHMEKEKEDILLKDRSSRACISAGYRLYMSNFKRIFRASWLAALFFAALQVLTHWSKLQGISTGTTHRASLSTKFWAKFGR